MVVAASCCGVTVHRKDLGFIVLCYSESKHSLKPTEQRLHQRKTKVVVRPESFQSAALEPEVAVWTFHQLWLKTIKKQLILIQVLAMFQFSK